jgi:hypothetical protein
MTQKPIGQGQSCGNNQWGLIQNSTAAECIGTSFLHHPAGILQTSVGEVFCDWAHIYICNKFAQGHT